MRMESAPQESIKGNLRITPRLEWPEIKETSYLPLAYWGLVGRNSGLSSPCSLVISDTYIEEKDAFTKTSDVVQVEADSWSMDMRSILYSVREMIERFPGHSFSGKIWWQRDDRSVGLLVVKDNETTWLEPTTVWVLHGEKTKNTVTSRWVAEEGWVDDTTRQRLSQANALVAKLHGLLLSQPVDDDQHAALHQERGFCGDQACVLNLAAEHLLREGAGE